MSKEQDEYYNKDFNKKVWEDNKFTIGIILGMIIATTIIKIGITYLS